MIRAMIGTVAVLAGYAVVERSVDASTGQGDACTPTDSYTWLQPGEFVPLRAEPAMGAPVVGRVQARVSGTDGARTIVRLSGSQGGWARISTAHGEAQGWMPADLLMVDARVSGPVDVRSRPGVMGPKLASLEGGEETFRVLGCRGAWLHVISAHTGDAWIDRWCAKEEGCRG
jgi:hypothetical protein